MVVPVPTWRLTRGFTPSITTSLLGRVAYGIARVKQSGENRRARGCFFFFFFFNRGIGSARTVIEEGGKDDGQQPCRRAANFLRWTRTGELKRGNTLS